MRCLFAICLLCMAQTVPTTKTLPYRKQTAAVAQSASLHLPQSFAKLQTWGLWQHLHNRVRQTIDRPHDMYLPWPVIRCQTRRLRCRRPAAPPAAPFCAARASRPLTHPQMPPAVVPPMARAAADRHRSRAADFCRLLISPLWHLLRVGTAEPQLSRRSLPSQKCPPQPQPRNRCAGASSLLDSPIHRRPALACTLQRLMQRK